MPTIPGEDAFQDDAFQRTDAFQTDLPFPTAFQPFAFQIDAFEAPFPVTTSGIATGEAFGVPTIVRVSRETGIATAEALGTTKVVFVARGTGISAGEAFGSATVARKASAAGQIASAATVSSATVTRIARDQGIASAETLGTPTARRSVTATGIASAATVSSATVETRESEIGIPSAEAEGTPTVRRSITAAAITSAESFGTPRAERTVSTRSIRAPQRRKASFPLLLGSSVAAGDTVGVPRLARTARPAGVSSQETSGTPTVRRTVVTRGIPAGGLRKAAFPLLLSGYATSVGKPAVTRSAPSIRIVGAGGIPAPQTRKASIPLLLGQATATEPVGARDIVRVVGTVGIPSEETFAGGQSHTSSSAGSGYFDYSPLRERPGHPNVAFPEGIPSAEAFGVPHVELERSTIGRLLGFVTPERHEPDAPKPAAPPAPQPAPAPARHRARIVVPLPADTAPTPTLVASRLLGFVGTTTRPTVVFPAAITSQETFGSSQVALGSPRDAEDDLVELLGMAALALA